MTSILTKKPGSLRSAFVWISLAILLFLSLWLIPDSFFEKWYTHGLFIGIRVVYDTLLGWIPFPMIYLILAITIFRIWQWARQYKNGFVFMAIKALGGFSIIIILFYVLWGFNYKQTSLQDKLGFDLGTVTQPDVDIEFEIASSVLEEEAGKLSESLKKDETLRHHLVTDHQLREDVREVLVDLGLPAHGKVRVRQLWPPGFLLRWSTAGIYIPHALEGHIDQGLLSVQKPFTIAHEMAHGYGVADEGACNFIAWLACSKSSDPWIRFAGALTYWRYVAVEMPDDRVLTMLDTLDPVISHSLHLIRENDRKYPDILPAVRDAVYSTYLKQHGVRGGLRSYNYVVKMAVLYRKEKPKDF